MKPTKEEFHAYLQVQYSGLTNMFVTSEVQRLAYDNTNGTVFLDLRRIAYIIKNYAELKKEYGDIQ